MHGSFVRARRTTRIQLWWWVQWVVLVLLFVAQQTVVARATNTTTLSTTRVRPRTTRATSNTITVEPQPTGRLRHTPNQERQSNEPSSLSFVRSFPFHSNQKNQTTTITTFPQQQHQQPQDHRQTRSICGCHPGMYEFTFDFARTSCFDMKLSTKGTGVTYVSCTFTPTAMAKLMDNVQFKVVHHVHIREYNADGQWLNDPQNHPQGRDGQQQQQERLDGPFHNGESFVYTSVIANAPRGGGVNWREIPAKMKVQLIGINRLNDLTDFHFTLYFSNDCLSYPVIVTGDYMGPLTVVRSMDMRACILQGGGRWYSLVLRNVVLGGSHHSNLFLLFSVCRCCASLSVPLLLLYTSIIRRVFGILRWNFVPWDFTIEKKRGSMDSLHCATTPDHGRWRNWWSVLVLGKKELGVAVVVVVGGGGVHTPPC